MSLLSQFKKLDNLIIDFSLKYGVVSLRISIALVFIWFGALKPLGMSPAEILVKNTVYWFDPNIFFPILGYWEVIIGLAILWRPTIRLGIFLLALQMPGTALPLVILSDVCFTSFPFGLTLEGQYIIKNLVLIAAAGVISGTVHRQSSDHKIL